MASKLNCLKCLLLHRIKFKRDLGDLNATLPLPLTFNVVIIFDNHLHHLRILSEDLVTILAIEFASSTMRHKGVPNRSAVVS